MGAVYLEGAIKGAIMMERDKAKFNNVSDITSVHVQTNNGIEEISARMFVNACGPWVCDASATTIYDSYYNGDEPF